MGDFCLLVKFVGGMNKVGITCSCGRSGLQIHGIWFELEMGKKKRDAICRYGFCRENQDLLGRRWRVQPQVSEEHLRATLRYLGDGCFD